MGKSLYFLIMNRLTQAELFHAPARLLLAALLLRLRGA